MEDCIFCKIVKGEIPAKLAYEDAAVLAFHDISPMAPIHILIISKQHISSLIEANKLSEEELGHMLQVTSKLALELGLNENGYRVVTNCGNDGGQSVEHLHFHLLAGKIMNTELC
ncbi:MAG: histidine triad nucleotide-binding protein [Clostridia bacterium]